MVFSSHYFRIDCVFPFHQTYTGPQYITSSILVGLLIGASMIFILVIGIYVIMSVEAPVRFPRRIFVVKKEY